MTEPFYVPFEPGAGVDGVFEPRVARARVVDAAPQATDIMTEAADAWFPAPTVDTLHSVTTREPAEPQTRVAIFRDKRFLLIAFDCAEPEMPRIRRAVPAEATDGKISDGEGDFPRSIAYDDHVEVFLDDAHDKTNYHWLRINVNGAAQAMRVGTAMSWTTLPVLTWPDPVPLEWTPAVAERADGWRAAVRIDLASIGVASDQPTVGLNLIRCRNVDLWRCSSWADVVNISRIPALALGDLYLTPSGPTVRRVDFGRLETGENRVTVAVDAPADASARLNVRVGGNDEGGAPSEDSAIPGDLIADFHLPPDRVAWAVTLEVTDSADGASAYRATFPLNNHANTVVNHPYSAADGPLGEPDPADADFHDKKLRQVISRLPKFHRETTAQGAPSDFTLVADDGSVSFNLMAAGALKRIADWLCGLYDSDVDRLVAVALLTNDNWVTVHAADRVSMHTHLTSLSQLRLGAGHCYSRAAAGAGIVCELPDPATGENHRAWATLVGGHVIVAIERRGDVTYIDPSFGHFFFNSGNTDLATSAELAADHSLVTRVVKGPRRLRNYTHPDRHTRLEPGTIVWPTGAPPR